MAYLMQNGVNLGPVIEVTSLPTGTDINKHVVYRLIHYDDPFVIPEEYRSSYHGIGLGFQGTGNVYVEREIVEEEIIEESWMKPIISPDGIQFPEVEEGWEPQNVWGWHSWESMAAIAATVPWVVGFFTPGDLDDQDEEVPVEFSVYWDHNANTIAINYGTDTPQGPKVCDGFYIWDGRILKQIDGDPVEMVGASYTADGASGLVPQPLKQNGFAALLSDGTFGFPEATVSTYYGTGGQCSWDTDPDYWGLIGKNYNDKATGGFVSYDSPTHPMLSVSSYPKECLLHVDMQWNGNKFIVTEKATPIVNTTNGATSPITYIRTGYFTKASNVPLRTSHFSGAIWNPWYSASDDDTIRSIITNVNAVETIGRYKNASVAPYENLHFTYTVPAATTITTASGNVVIQIGVLTTEVVADAFMLTSSDCVLFVNQTIEKLNGSDYKSFATYKRHGYCTISSVAYTIGDWWSTISWDSNWEIDAPAVVKSLTKTQYDAITAKDPNTIYVVDMFA